MLNSKFSGGRTPESTALSFEGLERLRGMIERGMVMEERCRG